MAEVTDARRRDEEIQAEVEETLRWDGRIQSDGIETSVAEGVVELKGSVPNFTSRAAAVEEAGLIPGVMDVVDGMKVEIKKGVPGVADDVLAARAMDILQWDSSLDTEDIEVLSREGILELEGSVDAHWKIQRAFDLVMGIRGVQDVRNNLAVVPTHNVADESLADQVVKALRRSPLVNEGRVEVEVKNGIVTLNGTVPSWMEVNTAREVVSNTPGTRDIRNFLETAQEPAPA